MVFIDDISFPLLFYFFLMNSIIKWKKEGKDNNKCIGNL